MSDTNPDKDQLETLQQMLEAEMRGTPEPEAAPAKTPVVEAKPDDLGSLLGDLLSEAEKEVGRERPDLTGTLNDGSTSRQPASPAGRTPVASGATAAPLAETSPSDLTSTLQDTKPGMEGLKTGQDSNRKTMMMAAAAVIAAAAIFGYLTQPKPEMALPDIGQRVGDTLSNANLKWQAQEAKRQVQEAKLMVEEAKKAEAAAKKKAAEAMQAADALKATELAKAQEDAQKAADEEVAREADSEEGSSETTAKSGSTKSKKASREKSKSSSQRKSGKRRRGSRGKKLRIKTNVF